MGLGSFLFGNTGYRPNQEQVERMGEGLPGAAAPGGMSYFEPKKKYYYKGQEIDEDTYNQYSNYNHLREGLSQKEGVSPYQQAMQKAAPKFKPGESGYNSMGVQYRPYAMPTSQYDFYNQGAQALVGAQNMATEGALRGSRSAGEQLAGVFGRRGLARSGVANQALGGEELRLGGQLADINRQNALALAQLQQQQQQLNIPLEMERARLGEQQSQFGSQFGRQGIISQYDLDRAMRAEKLGYARQPYEDMLRLYGLQAPISAQGTPGWLGQIGSAVSGFGTGIGAIGGHF